MGDRIRHDLKWAHGSGHALAELDCLQLEAALDLRRSRKEHLHRLYHAVAQAGRTSQHQRSLAAGELLVENEEWDAAKVVAVQVRHEHRVDRSGCESQSRQTDQRRRPAVEQHVRALATERDTRLETPAAAEGVARADELHDDHAQLVSSIGTKAGLRYSTRVHGALTGKSEAYFARAAACTQPRLRPMTAVAQQ